MTLGVHPSTIRIGFDAHISWYRSIENDEHSVVGVLVDMSLSRRIFFWSGLQWSRVGKRYVLVDDSGLLGNLVITNFNGDDYDNLMSTLMSH